MEKYEDVDKETREKVDRKLGRVFESTENLKEMLGAK